LELNFLLSNRSFKAPLQLSQFQVSTFSVSFFLQFLQVDLLLFTSVNSNANQIFMVFVRKEHIMTCNSLQDAIKAAIMTFFVLMENFPKEASMTWEIIQQVFARIVLPHGASIGMKNDENSMNKLMKLLIELLQYTK
jgi:hypothetical protein